MLKNIPSPKHGRGYFYFVRLYDPALEKPLYSSLVIGQWDTLTQQGGGNVDLQGVCKTAKGLVAVGLHEGTGAEIPLASVPGWGNSNYNGQSAVLAYLEASNIANEDDDPVVTTVAVEAAGQKAQFVIYPNPAQGQVRVRLQGEPRAWQLELRDALGRQVRQADAGEAVEWILDLEGLQAGIYFLRAGHDGHREIHKLIVQ